jgi:hypothetical protein
MKIPILSKWLLTRAKSEKQRAKWNATRTAQATKMWQATFYDLAGDKLGTLTTDGKAVGATDGGVTLITGEDRIFNLIHNTPNSIPLDGADTFIPMSAVSYYSVEKVEGGSK